MIGQTIAHYTITAKLGAGGMGEVFRATDAKLNRDVALKILPESYTADAQRMGRFQREAQLLASLNHTNIAAIYGLEESAGRRALVLELVEGEDLSELLRARALRLEEGLEIAVQIAEALESAHEKGIIHRDLKPANVKITPDGKVKVLDFGLAKALVGDPTEDPSEVSLSMSPTMTAGATGAGLILGTAAYMSPEQARGKAVDRRADIWAFGVLLFELLTRKQLFAGETVSDTLASVIKDEPDWTLIPPGTPPLVVELLRRCMEKDPRRRLQSIGEARIALDDLVRGASDGSSSMSVLSSSMHTGFAPEAEPVRTGRPQRGWWIAASAALVVVALASGWVAQNILTHEPEARLRKFTLTPPGLMVAYPTNPVMSPDGRRIAYFANGSLMIHDLHSLEATAVPGTEAASAPFWSWDSNWLAWGQSGRILKIPASGGSAVAVCDVPFAVLDGGCWAEDDVLYLAPNAGPMYRVASRGGDAQPVFPAEPDESDFHTPTSLPGSRGILYTVHDKDGRESVEVFVDGSRRPVFRIPGARIEYVAWAPMPGSSSRGHLIYHRMGSNDGIWAVPFNLDRFELDGEAFILDPDGAFPTVGTDGSLMYALGAGGGAQQLALVRRGGEVLQTIGQPQTGIMAPALSPDGRFVLVSAVENESRNIWMHDIERQTRTRVTFGDDGEWLASWINGGDDVHFVRGSAQTNRIWVQPADGTHEPRELIAGYNLTGPSTDGWVAFNRFFPETGDDLYVHNLGGDGEPQPLRATPATETGPQLSPDGRFLAYMSNESGGNQIYLTEFPSGAGKWQVSTGGGAWPCWSRAGDAIIYRVNAGATASLMSVSFAADPVVKLGSPEVIMSSADAPDLQFGMGFRGYAPTDDPDEFIMIKFGEEHDARVSRLVYSEDWYASYLSQSK